MIKISPALTLLSTNDNRIVISRYCGTSVIEITKCVCDMKTFLSRGLVCKSPVEHAVKPDRP